MLNNSNMLTLTSSPKLTSLKFLFGIKHPFPKPILSDPISAMNRADLHMFNVEGMLVFAENATLFPEVGVRISSTNRVRNADGYSSYLDSSLDGILPTNADVHPYRTYFVNYEDGEYSPSNPYDFQSLVLPKNELHLRQS